MNNGPHFLFLFLFSFFFQLANSFLAELDWEFLGGSFSPDRFIHCSFWMKKRKYFKIELTCNINLMEASLCEEWLQRLHCHNGERLAWIRLSHVQRLYKLIAIIWRLGWYLQLLAWLLKQYSHDFFHVVYMWQQEEHFPCYQNLVSS